jgi:hypothetical protein
LFLREDCWFLVGPSKTYCHPKPAESVMLEDDQNDPWTLTGVEI